MLKTFSILAAAAAVVVFAGSAVAPRAEADVQPVPLIGPASPPDSYAAVENCDAAPGFEGAALSNAGSLDQISWSPFGRAERGWAIYEQHVAKEIGVTCGAGTPGFAAALARWQEAHGLAGGGEATLQTLMAMKTGWQSARPYVAVRAAGVCPDAPAESSLTTLSADEGYMGKRIMLQSHVAEAYRAMVAAARQEVPELAADPQMLRIFSGYRSPSYDAARCARDGNCGGAARATCSVHRTAEAFDLVVGAAPGFGVDSSADANRLYQSRTAAYRWLVANAERFGFINYSFEPWHWEWRGQPSSPQRLQQAAIP